MNKHRLRLAALAATLATGIIVSAGTIAASADPVAASHSAAATATEHFQMMQTSATSSKAGLIAYGRFTAHGIDRSGNKVDTFVFPNGTVKVAHSAGKGSQNFNPRTCMFTIREHGTYRLEGGTGAYRGIAGGGSYQLRILALGARSGGKCTQNRAPLAYQQIVSAAGPVQLAR